MMKNIAIYLAGCICGAIVLGAVFLIWEFRAQMKSWGNTIVYSDIEVRDAIKRSGINLPRASWNLFYATDHAFPDSVQWITLTVPHEELWRFIESSLHKEKRDFKQGFPEGNPVWNEIWVNQNQEIDTSLWTPKKVKNPLIFSIKKEDKGSGNYEDWIVDEEFDRIFIVKWTT
jgi:hypothetical protein